MARRFVAALLVAALAVVTGGCATGSSSDSRPDQDARLMLDAAPNGIHAGIYLAIQRGYDEAEGVNLDVQTPERRSDPVRALVDGQADLALVDIHDLAAADARGRDLVGVMALVQTPLAAVVAQPGIASPRQLAGRRVGVGRGRADAAVLDSIVAGDGGDPARVRYVTVGSDPSRAVLSRRVAGATVAWNLAGVALTGKRPGLKEFRVEDYGAPSYPELLLATTRETLETNAPVVRAAVRALRRGYEGAINDPDSAVSALTDAEPTIDRTQASAQLDAVSPSFTAGADFFGQLDPATLARWARWERRFGVVSRTPDVRAMFDPPTARSGLNSDPDA